MSNEKETLPIAQQGYDLFIHAMSLHAANDPIGQLIQAKQVLRPDGLMLCVALGGETLSELRKATLTAETKLRGGASPRVFPMADLRDYGALLQRAGFTLPVADRLTLSVEHATLFALARDLRAMGETNTLLGRDDGITNRTFWEEVAAQYPKNAETGYLRTTFEFVFLSGWAPHPEQPNPLRPGSVKTGLATAIENARNATSGPQDAIDPEAQTPRSRKETE